MSGRYKPYPEYKKSGVEWLDKMPVGWNHIPIKYMALSSDGLFLDGDWIESKDLSSEGVRYLTTGNVGVGEFKEQGTGRISDLTFSKLDCTEVQAGDILISRLNTPIGRACQLPPQDSKVVTSVDNVIFRPDACFSYRFVVYMLSGDDYFAHTEILSRGATMQRISRGLLGNIRVPTPTLDEQIQIADFLDYETAKIDLLIEKQLSLIDLLKEKRQAVISHAVTKGLNPDAPMKDSGVEWLGDVPEGWAVCALAYRYEVALGKMLDGKKITGKKLAPYLRNVDVQWGRIRTKNLNEMDFDASDRIRFSLQRGDILVCEGGEVGRSAIWEAQLEECYYQKALHRLRPHDESRDSPWFFYWMMFAATLNGCFTAGEAKATIAHLPAEIFRRHKFPFPPVAEQIAIAEFLNTKTRKLDAIAVKAQHAIDLLKERRGALISAAVTGKIDVRDWKAPESDPAKIQ